jgi:hypothetical protein
MWHDFAVSIYSTPLRASNCFDSGHLRAEIKKLSSMPVDVDNRIQTL